MDKGLALGCCTTPNNKLERETHNQHIDQKASQVGKLDSSFAVAGNSMAIATVSSATAKISAERVEAVVARSSKEEGDISKVATSESNDPEEKAKSSYEE